MRIGLFGGTFAPPHNTHVEIVDKSIKQLKLDKIYVMPCGIPPHKTTNTSVQDRLAMTELAFAHLPRVVVDDYEINKPTVGYTYQSLEYLKDMYPLDTLYLIIGGDSFDAFESWEKPERIAQLAILAICERQGIDVDFNKRAGEIINKYRATVVRVKVNQSMISSTLIRTDYQFGNIPNLYVPTRVDAYICYNNLYSQHRDKVEMVRALLTDDKFTHTYGVVITGLAVGKGMVDEDKIFLACLLHDCAKYIKKDQYAKYGFVPPAGMPNSIIHGPLGARVANKLFGITDEEILDAIYYHTMARANMTMLDKIVYIADKIEPNRNYPTNHLAGSTLDQTFVNVLREVVRVEKDKNHDLSLADTQSAIWQYLTDKSITDNQQDNQEDNQQDNPQGEDNESRIS
ncbi:MAG: nicotinate (nicotinamide) nucleotide adenylyltransferase [Clostridia bacterium]|nr:nicotinate (nicotinamide) nucleotide adenylyltransferase [Clostridia bacterium]